MYATPRVREIVQLVTAEVRRRLGGGAKIIWFGSWVKGTAVETSDIDLAVSAPEPISPVDYGYLVGWLEEDLPALYTVDLVNLGEIGDRFRQQITEEGVVV